jgi:hypothetical protein
MRSHRRRLRIVIHKSNQLTFALGEISLGCLLLTCSIIRQVFACFVSASTAEEGDQVVEVPVETIVAHVLEDEE